MRIKSFMTAAAIAATLFLASCKDSGTSGLSIPKDAAIVVHVNTSSLTSKLSWADIKASNWFKEMTEKENDSLTKKLLDNPENSGVDMKSDFVFFTRKQGPGGLMVFEGKLKDAAAFEKTLKGFNKEEDVAKDGDLKYMEVGEKNLISWTGSTFVMMSNFTMPSASVFSGGRHDKFSADSLRIFTKQLLDLSGSDQLQKDDRFSDLMKDNGDIHFWMNTEQYMSSFGGDYLSMLKIGDLMKDNVSGATLSFDDGKITMKSKQWYGKEMAKLMDKHKPREIDEALLNRIPSGNVVGVMALNFDPAAIMDFFKASGFDGMMNSFLGQLNITANELVSATKGQFLFAITDFELKKKEYSIPGYGNMPPSTYHRTEKDMNVLVAASVNNKSTFDKLLGMMREKMQGRQDTSVNYQVNNDWFAASNKKATVDQFMSGTTNKMPFADKIKGTTFGLYVDLQKLFKGMATDLNDASDSAAFNATTAMWQDVVGKGGDYKNGVATGEFTINLVDKSRNSLKQLNEYFDKLAAAKKQKKQEMMMDVPTYNQVDSVATPVEAAPVQY